MKTILVSVVSNRRSMRNIVLYRKPSDAPDSADYSVFDGLMKLKPIKGIRKGQFLHRIKGETFVLYYSWDNEVGEWKDLRTEPTETVALWMMHYKGDDREGKRVKDLLLDYTKVYQTTQFESLNIGDDELPT